MIIIVIVLWQNKSKEEKFPPTINKKVAVFEGNMMMGLVVLSGTGIMKTLRSLVIKFYAMRGWFCAHRHMGR
jgi:hypothetical protein